MLNILCDLDSVVVDLMGSWLACYNDAYDDDLNMDRILSWDTHLYTKPECGAAIYKYLTPDLFARLKPLPGAVEAVNVLTQHHSVHFITSAPRGTADAKIEWVRRYFPHLKDNVFTGKHKYMLKGDVLIDDCAANLVEYKTAHPGSTTITIDYPYNRNEVDQPFIDVRAMSGRDPERAWKEILAAISFVETV